MSKHKPFYVFRVGNGLRWLLMASEHRDKPEGERPYYYASDNLGQVEWAARTWAKTLEQTGKMPEPWGYA